MKDIYFSDMEKDDDIPILTPEEIELIKKRRQQKFNEINNADDGFITPPDNFQNRGYNSDYDFDPEEFQKARKSAPKKTINVEFEDDYEDYYDEPVRQPIQANQKPKKKKGCGCGCLGASVFAVFLALVIAFVGCFGYVLNMMNKMNIKESAINSFVNSSDLTRADDVKNILLIGLDDDGDSGTSRSDTMMLLSVDRINKKLKLTSFLRDMWVEIPGYKKAKLNASYSKGGAQLTMDTIEYNFDVDIDNYVIVDFEMFRKIIDALGGITVEITEKEAAFINRTTSSTVKAGLNELNGKKALIYARIRKLDSDFYRTQRQRKVITAIVEKIKTINPVDLIEISKDILPLITTDINAVEMVFTGISSLSCLGGIEQLQVPADNAYVSKRISGQAALVPDMEKNIKNIKDFIYGEGV